MSLSEAAHVRRICGEKREPPSRPPAKRTQDEPAVSQKVQPSKKVLPAYAVTSLYGPPPAGCEAAGVDAEVLGEPCEGAPGVPEPAGEAAPGLADTVLFDKPGEL
jgi:hypothetical protein